MAAVFTFLLGAIIAGVNAKITEKLARRKTNAVVGFSLARQAIDLLYLALVYFISKRMDIAPVPALLGAAAGLTIPMIVFAVRSANRLRKKGDDSEWENRQK